MNKRSLLLTLFAMVAQIFVETSQPLWARTSEGLVASAKGVVLAKLLDPLQKKEADRSRFSRAAQPPQARRIRMLGTTPQTDVKGRSFVAFAIDESRGYGGSQDEAGWFKDVITGCVYPETEEVLVRRGQVYYASSILLGRQTPVAPADICRTD